MIHLGFLLRSNPSQEQIWIKMVWCQETLALGPDSIPAEAMQSSTPEPAVPLAELLQCSFSYLKWKITGLHTVHKKQDKSNPVNYCPIILLLISSNMTEAVVNSAVKPYLLINVLLTDAQPGFYPNRLVPDFTTSWCKCGPWSLIPKVRVRIITHDIKAEFDQA